MATEKKLYCKNCDIFMGVLRDAALRKGMVVYCAACGSHIDRLLSVANARKADTKMPEFMESIFGKFNK